MLRACVPVMEPVTVSVAVNDCVPTTVKSTLLKVWLPTSLLVNV